MSTARYHSPRRADAAAATRSAILAAARELFLTAGYADTTVPQIARAARVAVPTVYTSTGGKADILAALLMPVVGDPAVGETRTALAAATDPVEVIRLTGEGVRLTHERHWDIVTRLFPQAQSEAAAAEVYQRILDTYQEALGRTAERLDQLGALKPGITVPEALDILWLYLGEGAWLALCRDRGWSLERARDWLTAAAAAALIERDPLRGAERVSSGG
ncbi:helix-turn-helix transcriptional regulator [Actinoplanes sp. TBRC 11911]|uniref:TetR/AcrR family transcriptional regulator n=1 Tax=Actinoplanes sp. TBRC 11911 TaxID=2729386 RepID=UPI00145DD136|nr:TetR/AcrR family transcriptional regulator [Actinoplanes sp. TBRC 11911]NMO54052.1 helix-turn-helix transcriptional regulator [Actinoplanes sp. TBRC 11911]